MVVVGGSRGLGKEIAGEFGSLGAKIILMARTESELVRASEELQSRNIKASYLTCDATDWNSVKTAFERLNREHGEIDILVNSIGRSTRSDILEIDLEEYRDLVDLNYLGVVRCTKAALGSVLKTNGHIINIGSLASKTAWPFMGPYTGSKFALAAFTHQLRIELGNQIHVLLVCPGPIRRSDEGTRYDQQAGTLPGSARRPGAGTRIKGICPKKLAKKIVRSCERRKAELIVPFKANLLFLAAAISTRLSDWLLNVFRRKDDR